MKKNKISAIPAEGTVPVETADLQKDPARSWSVATRDHKRIRQWAEQYGAEPATGEATASGPATVHVNDGGTGIRFNFPGATRFRPISWDEWLEHFDRHGLVFVFEEDVADRAYQLWERRGNQHGRDRDDWFEAERQLRETGGGGARYRLVRQEPEDE